jgi:hypothetical protein
MRTAFVPPTVDYGVLGDLDMSDLERELAERESESLVIGVTQERPDRRRDPKPGERGKSSPRRFGRFVWKRGV